MMSTAISNEGALGRWAGAAKTDGSMPCRKACGSKPRWHGRETPTDWESLLDRLRSFLRVSETL